MATTTKKKKIQKRVRFSKTVCSGFVALTILILGTVSLVKSGGIEYHSVLNALTKIIPASIVMGWLGYQIGKILDYPKKNRADEFRNIIMDELAEMDKNLDLSQYSTDLPDFGEINAKLISEGQAAEPKIEMSEEDAR